MVTKSEDVSCKNCSDQSQQTENPNSKSGKLETTKKESSLRSLPNTDVAKSPHIEHPKTETPVSHPNQEEGSGEHTPGSNNEEGCTLSNTPANVLHNLNQEKFILSITPEKALHKLPPRRNLEIVSHVLQSTQEQKPAVIPDKPSEDGYNWRKYGQKFVRGNEFIRSYYKCTFLNCTAKKQVERSHDGRITDIKYLRKHEHPKPQRSLTGSASFVSPIQVRKADSTSLAGSEDKSAIVHVESTEDPKTSTIVAHKDVEVDGLESSRTRDVVDDGEDPNPKRLKTDVPTVNDIPVNKINGEPRIVVQTMSEVDIVSDGYRWRKYGQKLVKGNPNPRSYYRCSSTGCPVKKHVERASHDPKVVLTTYEGQHDHDMPSGRTLTFNSTENGNNNKSSVTPTIEDVKPEPTDENKNENEAVALVPVSANC